MRLSEMCLEHQTIAYASTASLLQQFLNSIDLFAAPSHAVFLVDQGFAPSVSLLMEDPLNTSEVWTDPPR
jgi:hypothetical protein